jgi:hypothetical protein
VSGGAKHWQAKRFGRLVTCRTVGCSASPMTVRGFRKHMVTCGGERLSTGEAKLWTCPVGCGRKFMQLEMRMHIGGCGALAAAPNKKGEGK